MNHHLDFALRNLHGCFSPERAPILTIHSGDTLTCQTLDAGWGLDPFAEDVLGKRIPLGQRSDPVNDTGHCLVGPIAVRGAQPGHVLQIDICQLVPASVGATWVGEVQEFLPQLGVEGYFWLPWHIDVAAGIACSSSGHHVPLAPFLGVMGLAPSAPGSHATRPPRICGGNIDCKDLTVGSSVFLPIQVPEALFSFGDGHAAQGDGEVGGTAIECGMEQVQLRLTVRDDVALVWPQARTRGVGHLWLCRRFDCRQYHCTQCDARHHHAAVGGVAERSPGVGERRRPSPRDANSESNAGRTRALAGYGAAVKRSQLL